MDLLISGGFILLAIVLLSVYAVYLFFVRLFKLSRERLDTEELMVRVNAAVRDRDLDLALDACEQHGGPVARVLQAALLRLPYGRQAVEAAFAEASLLEEQSLTRGLRPLATIAQVAPLLGLLGTVTGMIIAFGEISASGTGNPGLLAGGIGQALVTTAAGLIVAIPVLIGQNYLASRVEGILSEIDRRREELMANVVQAVAARKESVGGAAGAAGGAVDGGAGEPMTRPATAAPTSRSPSGASVSRPRPAGSAAIVGGPVSAGVPTGAGVAAGALFGGGAAEPPRVRVVSPVVEESDDLAADDALPLGRVGRLRFERAGDDPAAAARDAPDPRDEPER